MGAYFIVFRLTFFNEINSGAKPEANSAVPESWQVTCGEELTEIKELFLTTANSAEEVESVPSTATHQDT